MFTRLVNERNRHHLMKKMRRIPKTLVVLIFLIGLQANARPLIVAHRGASRDAPENTIPAFELAWKQGSDAIEGDFHLTRDGEIVCIHDETTKEVAHEEKMIADSTLNELKQLDVGAWFGRRWKGTKIPTIAEVFKTIPEGKKIFIEIKCGPEILPKLFEKLRTSGLTREQVVVISFHAEVIYTLKHHAPGIKALMLSGFEKDRQSGKLKPSAEDVLKILQLTRADGFSSEAHKLLDEAFVKRILDEGYEYHVWTVDKIKTAKRFAEMGVMSITTNDPGYLRKKIIE